MDSLRFSHSCVRDSSRFGSRRSFRYSRNITRTRRLYQTTVGATAGANVDSFVDGTIQIVKSTGGVIKGGIDLILQGFQIVEKTLPVVNEKIEQVKPVAKQVSKQAADATSTAVTAATPALKSAGQAAAEFLSGQGVDLEVVKSGTSTVVKTASDAVDVATPAVKSSYNFLTTTEPLTLGYYLVAVAAVYYVGPSFLSFTFAALRGYGGDISPPAALDSVLTDTNAIMIDIRGAAEKDKSGVLDVPGNISGRVVELEFAITKNRKLRGQLRNPEDVESKITALQIAALRRTSKSTRIFLLDRNGSISKQVAKCLKSLGFDRSFVVSGGYGGWIQSKLQTKPSPTVFRAEVVAPTSVFATVLKGGTTKRPIERTRRALPPPMK